MDRYVCSSSAWLMMTNMERWRDTRIWPVARDRPINFNLSLIPLFPLPAFPRNCLTFDAFIHHRYIQPQLLWSSRWGITVCGSISFIPFSSDSPKENVIGLANLQDRVNSFFLSFHEWRMFTLQLLTNKSGKIYPITTVEIRNIFQDRMRDRDESEIINIPAFKIR